MNFWFFMLGVPLLACGVLACVRPSAMSGILVSFPRNRIAGAVLCVAAWFFTAYELDTIGIEVFDRFLKMFPGQLWIMAAVLSFLTCWWMSNLLPIRALSALFMLFPAEMFPMIRLEESSWRLTLVVFAYICITTGMFGMFYPWRIRQAAAWMASKKLAVTVYGAAHLVAGALFIVLGSVL